VRADSSRASLCDIGYVESNIVAPANNYYSALGGSCGRETDPQIVIDNGVDRSFQYGMSSSRG